MMGQGGILENWPAKAEKGHEKDLEKDKQQEQEFAAEFIQGRLFEQISVKVGIFYFFPECQKILLNWRSAYLFTIFVASSICEA